jgi:hypothetical protein
LLVGSGVELTAGGTEHRLMVGLGFHGSLLHCEAEERDLKDSHLLDECDLSDGLLASVGEQDAKVKVTWAVIDGDLE